MTVNGFRFRSIVIRAQSDINIVGHALLGELRNELTEMRDRAFQEIQKGVER